jgi:hypothetical protein
MFLCSGLIAQAGHLANKFKPDHIDKYDDSSNPEEFIKIYHTVIEATGGDD